MSMNANELAQAIEDRGNEIAQTNSKHNHPDPPYTIEDCWNALQALDDEAFMKMIAMVYYVAQQDFSDLEDSGGLVESLKQMIKDLN